MLEEINEKNVAETIIKELGKTLQSVGAEDLNSAVAMIGAAERIFLAGAGRSALAVRGFAMRLMHMGKKVHVVGEITTPGIGQGDLLLIGSGSGRTGSLRSMAQKANSIGVPILLATIDRGSPIGSLADLVIEIAAPSTKLAGKQPTAESIQPMGSLFEQTLFLLFDCLVLLLMKKENLSSDEMFARHANLE